MFCCFSFDLSDIRSVHHRFTSPNLVYGSHFWREDEPICHRNAWDESVVFRSDIQHWWYCIILPSRRSRRGKFLSQAVNFPLIYYTQSWEEVITKQIFNLHKQEILYKMYKHKTNKIILKKSLYFCACFILFKT